MLCVKGTKVISQINGYQSFVPPHVVMFGTSIVMFPVEHLEQLNGKTA